MKNKKNFERVLPKKEADRSFRHRDLFERSGWKMGCIQDGIYQISWIN